MNQNDLKSNCRKLREDIPFIIKILVLTAIIFNILNYIYPSISKYLSNVPYLTIYKYQIWRIFTTGIITTSFWNIILLLMIWVKHASNLEATTGSIKYLIIFLINLLSIQLIYIIISLIISLIIQDTKFLKYKIDTNGKISNIGFWSYIVFELTLLSLSNPQYAVKLPILTCSFKAKYFPIIVFGLFCLINSFINDFEILCGIIYSFLYHFVIKKYLRISNELINRVENLRCIKFCIKFGGFIRNNKDDIDINIKRTRNVEIIHKNNIGYIPYSTDSQSNVFGNSINENGANIPGQTSNQK